MIGLDTNVLVRHLTQHGEGDEVARAGALLHSLTPANQGFIPLITLIETWWVLGSVYKIDVHDRLDAIEKMLRVGAFSFERRSAVQSAIAATRRGADFADALISATCAEERCTAVMTFDVGAVKRAEMTLVAAGPGKPASSPP